MANFLTLKNVAVQFLLNDQLFEFATKTGNIEQNQSAYGVGHSTESALLKVKSDLLHEMDNQEVTCLLLLSGPECSF